MFWVLGALSLGLLPPWHESPPPRLSPSPGPSSSWRRCPGWNREPPPLHCGGGVALCRVPRASAGGLPALAAATGLREGGGPGEGPKDPSRGRSRGRGRGAPEKNRVRNASPSRRPPARRNYFGLSSHVQLLKGGRGVGRIHFRGRGWGAGGRTSLGKTAAPPPSLLLRPVCQALGTLC